MNVKVNNVMSIGNNPEAEIVRIDKLNFAHLRIPKYQRPYKWSIKNVDDLIDDISNAINDEVYRLGTLIVHEDIENTEKSQTTIEYIVDGQQRIVTLALILFVCGLQNERKDEEIKEFFKNTFNHKDSKFHIRENYKHIKKRKEDIDKIWDYIINHCEFVKVKLRHVEEAFQFFDSQNARGKELSTGDKLKAFHLAAYSQKLKEDGKEYKDVQFWESTNPTKRDGLLNVLCRIRQWCKGNDCSALNDEIIETFYGIKREDVKRYPCYTLLDKYLENTENDVYNGAQYQIQKEFPFQILGEFIRGPQFFQYFKKYLELYDKISSGSDINDEKWTKSNEFKVMYKCGYPGWGNTGDRYMRELFNSILLLYIDRFGFAELSSICQKIFRECYGIRIEKQRIGWRAINNTAKYEHCILRTIALAANHDELKKYRNKEHKQLSNLPDSKEWKDIKENW